MTTTTTMKSLAQREAELVGYRNPNGTRLLMEWTCVCDYMHFVDAVDVHAVRCGNCGRTYELSTHIALLPPIGGFAPVFCPAVKEPLPLEKEGGKP